MESASDFTLRPLIKVVETASEILYFKAVSNYPVELILNFPVKSVVKAWERPNLASMTCFSMSYPNSDVTAWPGLGA